jgi:ABC-type polysaccharide/polyol phosphate export permease
MSTFALVTPELRNPRKWVGLAWHDVVQSYRRTLLGPFWLSLNMAIFALAMTLVYAAIFSVPTGEYSIYIVCSMMVWWWIMGILNEGGSTFLMYAQFIQSTPVDKSTFIWSMAVRQLIALLHHSIIYFAMIPFGLVTLNWNILLAVPAGALLFIWSVPVIAVLAILFVRYRDLQRFVSSATVVLMMVTPIFWKADMISGWRTLMIHFNPVYYAVELIRLPLLGKPVPLNIWLTVLGLTIFSWLFGGWFYQRYQRYIVFWV